jgi:hypothetical protein
MTDLQSALRRLSDLNVVCIFISLHTYIGFRNISVSFYLAEPLTKIVAYGDELKTRVM